MAQVSVHVGRDMDMIGNAFVHVNGWMVIGLNGTLVENIDPLIRWKGEWSEVYAHAGRPQIGQHVMPLVTRMKFGLRRP